VPCGFRACFGRFWIVFVAFAALIPSPRAVAQCADHPVVTLDIGHSPGRPGARSARGKPEYGFNRRFVQELQPRLEAGGFEVRVINSAGRDISITERARMVETTATGVSLSIHHDSVQPRYLSEWTVGGRSERYSDVFRGYSVFVSSRSGDPAGSLALARGVGEGLRAAGFHPSLHHGEAISGENRPIVDGGIGLFRFDGLAVLKAARVPALLLEIGVIVNRDEEKALEAPETRARAVAAIAAALVSVCG
jgi:N-acetylmuramoyl-L-alanine amidase